jgi:hypothetical protein
MSPTDTNLLSFGQAKLMACNCINDSGAACSVSTPKQHVLDVMLAKGVSNAHMHEVIGGPCFVRTLLKNNARKRRQLNVSRQDVTQE